MGLEFVLRLVPELGAGVPVKTRGQTNLTFENPADLGTVLVTARERAPGRVLLSGNMRKCTLEIVFLFTGEPELGIT